MSISNFGLQSWDRLPSLKAPIFKKKKKKQSPYVTLAIPGLPIQTRLASSFQKSSRLCLLSTGIMALGYPMWHSNSSLINYFIISAAWAYLEASKRLWESVLSFHRRWGNLTQAVLAQQAHSPPEPSGQPCLSFISFRLILLRGKHVCHKMHMEVRGKLAEFPPFYFHHVDPRNQTQVIGLGSAFPRWAILPAH